MKLPLISVIVPIYGIEKELPKCIDSIIRQTYKNLEIILVDDGSYDKCGSICDAYKKTDERIKVIHKINGGLVSARKAGLKVSSGELIGYVDGDDWIESNFFEELYMAFEQNQADIVCAGFRRDINNESDKVLNEIPCGFYKEEEIVKKVFPKMLSAGEFFYFGIYSYVWNKLFKRNVLYCNQMNVNEDITVGEDVACTFPAILQSQSIQIISNCSYHYQQRVGSMLKRIEAYELENKRLDILELYLNRIFSNSLYSDLLLPQVKRYMEGIRLIRSDSFCKSGKCCLPFFELKKSKKIAIFSAGTFGQNLYSRFITKKCLNVVGWFDKDYLQYQMDNLPVLPLEDIEKKEFDVIIIASLDRRYIDKVKEYLLTKGIIENRIKYIESKMIQENICRI